MDYKSCIFVAMAIWLKYFLEHHPEATFMMTSSMPPPNTTKEQHQKFIKTVTKTYCNRLVSVVFKSNDFKTIYKG